LDRSSSGANQFTWNAQDYARNSRMQEDFGRKHLGALNLAGSEAVLDIGCGDGRLTAEIARRVPGGRVVGIDSSPDMIAAARETFGTQHPNLTFKLMSATDLPFRKEFDLVFSTSALHWIKDHSVLLSRIAQSLKPGGRIYLVFGARGTLSELAPVIERLMEGPDWKVSFQNFDAPFGFYGAEEYRPWLARLSHEV
jgi:trans-aconitate methyltransferase